MITAKNNSIQNTNGRALPTSLSSDHGGPARLYLRAEIMYYVVDTYYKRTGERAGTAEFISFESAKHHVDCIKRFCKTMYTRIRKVY